MNPLSLSPQDRAKLDALQARFALKVSARLTERSQDLPSDVSERLRFARERALKQAKLARQQAVAAQTPSVIGSSLALLGGGGEHSGRWFKWASVLPLFALVAGLVLIDNWHQDNQISAAAEIDSALLADDLPPAAYSDNGFVEYLKTAND